MTDPVLDFVDAAAAESRLNLHSLVVRTPEGILTEAYWAPYTATDRQLVYSVSKTFTATAAGFALAEGLLHLDDRVADLVEPPGPITAGQREITVHHVLSMTTGHDADTVDLATHPYDDLAAQFWGTPPQTPVGSQHTYHNGASWAVAEAVRTVTGQSLLDYLRPRLLDPLGIDITWDTDERGRELGFSGVHVTTRDLAALGQLYASDGLWAGRRVLPEGWVGLASTAHVATNGDDPEWRYGYGYQVWRSREGFRLDGAYGQYALVFPETQTVIAITSAQPVSSQPLLDLVWRHLVGEVGADTPARKARLAALALRTPRDSGAPGRWRHEGRLRVMPSLAVGVEQSRVPVVEDLDVTRDVTGFTVSFTFEGHRARLTTPGPWRRQTLPTADGDVPVALAAAVSGHGGIRLRLCFTDTPHVLLVDAGALKAGLAWQAPPLASAQTAGLRAVGRS